MLSEVSTEVVPLHKADSIVIELIIRILPLGKFTAKDLSNLRP